MNRTFFVGICGGSASGKTSMAKSLMKALPNSHAVVLSIDNYYHDLRDFPKHISGNYDHPDSLDQAFLLSHLRDLKEGKSVHVPLYDFSTHTRGATFELNPPGIVIVEGILLYAMEAVSSLLDLKIFIDTSVDLMLVRRLRRDIAERGRSLDSVIDQYITTVRPMYFEFVAAKRNTADIIIPGDNSPEQCFDHLMECLNGMNIPELSKLE